MLHEEVMKYRELSGDLNPNTPISRIGGYLDGYERALEQKPREDVISRQAVLDAMYTLCDTGETLKENPWRDNPHIDAVVETIEQIPSVKPQQKIGYWIQTQEKNDAEPFILWECSCCHKEFRSVVHKVSNYCPSCGAKMVEPQESEE